MVLPNLSALRLEPTGPPDPQQARVDPDRAVVHRPTDDLPEDLREDIYMRAVMAAEQEFERLAALDEDRCGLPYPTLGKGVGMLGDPSDIKDYAFPMTKETFVPSDTALAICFVGPENAEFCGTKLVRLLCHREHAYYPEKYQRLYGVPMPAAAQYGLTWILTYILARDGVLIDWQKGTGRLVNPRLSEARRANAPFPEDPHRLSWREVLGHLLRARTWLPYHIPAFRAQMGLQALVARSSESDISQGRFTLRCAKRRVLAAQQYVRTLDYARYLAGSRPEVHGDGTVEEYIRKANFRLMGDRRLENAMAVIRACGPPHAWDTSAVTNFGNALSRSQYLDEQRDYNVGGEATGELRHACTYYFSHGLGKLWHWAIQAQAVDASQAILWILDNSQPNWPIGLWATSNATAMDHIFTHNEAFNQPINAWDVSKVGGMKGAFEGAKAFNQPLDKWEPKALKRVDRLFCGAKQFFQDLDAWASHLGALRTTLQKQLDDGKSTEDGDDHVLEFFELGDAYVLKSQIPQGEDKAAFQWRLCRWGPTAWRLHTLRGAS